MKRDTLLRGRIFKDRVVFYMAGRQGKHPRGGMEKGESQGDDKNQDMGCGVPVREQVGQICAEPGWSENGSYH